MWNLVLFEIEKCSIHLKLVSRVKSMCDVTLTPSYGSRFERLRFGSQQADWQFALLTHPKPKLMVFRSLDVSRKYTCFLYVFLSTKKVSIGTFFATKNFHNLRLLLTTYITGPRSLDHIQLVIRAKQGLKLGQGVVW